MKGFAVLGTITMLAVAPVFAQTPAAPAGAKPAPQAPPVGAKPAPQAPPPAAPGRSLRPLPRHRARSPRAPRWLYVVLQRIANESADGKTATTRIQALQQKKAAELTDKNKQLQTAQQRLEKEASVLSATASGRAAEAASRS